MYSPELGRFLQVDPVGFYAGMNFYMYCGNNPLNWVDPSGLCKEKEGGKGGNKGNFPGGYMYPPKSTPEAPKPEEKSNSAPTEDPRRKDPTRCDPVQGPPFPDEFTREAKWWEWVIWIPWRIWSNWNIPFTYLGPDIRPVPPTHIDWPGARKPRLKDFAT